MKILQQGLPSLTIRDPDCHEIVLFHFQHFVLILEKMRFNYRDWIYRFTERTDVAKAPFYYSGNGRYTP